MGYIPQPSGLSHDVTRVFWGGLKRRAGTFTESALSNMGKLGSRLHSGEDYVVDGLQLVQSLTNRRMRAGAFRETSPSVRG
jgi:hypothetical protein